MLAMMWYPVVLVVPILDWAANNSLLELHCLAGEGMSYVVWRASRMAWGLWLLQYAAAPMRAPLMAVVPCLNAFGTVMLRAALMACVTVAWAWCAAFSG